MGSKAFSCPVCHDVYEDPVILSCSHSFCNSCLKEWWARGPLRLYPICMTRSSTKNPPRNLALENLCEAFLQERAQRASGDFDICSLHYERLQLFCLDHLQPVCFVCRDSDEHTNHSIKLISEISKGCRAEVQTTLEPLKERLNVLKEDKEDWVSTIRDMKVQAQEIKRQIDDDFEKPQKVLQEECEARILALTKERKDNIHMMKENITNLNREIEDVADAITYVEKQLKAPNVSFFKNYKTTVERTKVPLPQEPQWPSGDLADLTNHLETLKMISLNQIEHLIKSAISRSVKYRLSAFRSDLRMYACELTLDPNTTSNGKLIMSEDNRLFQHFEKYQNRPDHPTRFDYWDQVLCSERLTRRCYWEVDWMGWVSIGVAYRGISRKGEGKDSCLGCNEKSWVLECSDDGYTTRHNDIETPISLQMPPPSRSFLFSFRSYLHSLWHWRRIVSGRVGVYVDGPAGSLSFYTVSSDTLTHIHTFYCNFTDDLLPAFRVKSFGSVSLCQM